MIEYLHVAILRPVLADSILQKEKPSHIELPDR